MSKSVKMWAIMDPRGDYVCIGKSESIAWRSLIRALRPHGRSYTIERSACASEGYRAVMVQIQGME